MTQAQKDFITFVDGGSLIPYYMDNSNYFNKPSSNTTVESIELDNKIYVKSMLGYYVSIVTSSFVRKIHADDYKRIKEIAELNQTAKSSRVQLTMEF